VDSDLHMVYCCAINSCMFLKELKNVENTALHLHCQSLSVQSLWTVLFFSKLIALIFFSFQFCFCFVSVIHHCVV